MTFTQMEGATRYYVYVYTLDGKWVANKYVSDAAATSATFEAGAIPAGTYEFYAEGYLSNYGYIEGEHVQATIGEPDADKAFKYYTNSDGENTITINGYLGEDYQEKVLMGKEKEREQEEKRYHLLKSSTTYKVGNAVFKHCFPWLKML